MLRWQNVLGAALGLLAGFTFMAMVGEGERKRPPSGPILSECDGHFRELVIQYEPGSKEVVASPYREFLGALEADVTVHVVCPSRAAFDDLRATVGPVRCSLEPVFVNHAMTTWSRDRWVAMAPATNGGQTTIWSPREEAAEEIWPARAGDERMGDDIAAVLSSSVRARRSSLYFDGGDFLADSQNVFVVPRLLQRNIQHTTDNRDEFLGILRSELKRNIILLEESPDHHAGMFMASVGNGTMLVGDPSLGRRYVPLSSDADGSTTNEFMHLPGGPDFSPQTQRLFDAVAEQCARVGYEVARIPVVPACDSRTYLTYVNVLMDQVAGRRVVYVPEYRGVEPMNVAAREIWEGLGYEVRPVDCTSTYRHFGCLHCLVNVLRRG
jgi:hypothetical protein